MRPQNLYNVDQPLKEALKENKKRGGVSDALRKRMKRPEALEGRNWRLNATNSVAYSNAFGEMLERRKKLKKEK